MTRLICLMILGGLAGCQTLRSTLQMDSNSRSPFLGLQWSVDRTPTRREESMNLAKSGMQGAIGYAGSSDVTPEAVRTVSLESPADRSGFVPTSNSKAHSGNLKYSLPTRTLKNDPERAAEVSDIVNRLSGL